MSGIFIKVLQKLLKENKKKIAAIAACGLLFGLCGCSAATTSPAKSSQSTGTVSAAKPGNETGAIKGEMAAANKVLRYGENGASYYYILLRI